MAKHHKKILILLVIAIAGGVIWAGSVFASCKSHNVWGYAWSENIGWISFRCYSGHWTLVDDLTPDYYSTYVWTNSATTQEDAYDIEDPPPGMTQTINSVETHIVFWGGAGLRYKIGPTGSETDPANTVNFGSVYAKMSGNIVWANGVRSLGRPGGGSWTWSDIKNLQVILGISTAQADPALLTQVYVTVNYDGGSLILRPNGTGYKTEIANPPLGTEVDYGVDINSTTGLFSGYAWSENIGWISFNTSELTGCPSGACEARLDLTTGEVSGWARALANGEGWDGWIKLSGSWTDGVTLNSSPDPSEFEGWAWGSDVVGWVSFNHSNTGAAADYKVMTSIKMNSSPTAVISCEDCANNPLNPCEAYQGDSLCLINNSTDPNGEGDISQSIWYIDEEEETSCSGKCNFTPQNWVGIGSYTAKLYVEDMFGLSDTATRGFKIKRDVAADFTCSLDNTSWQTCEDIMPIDGQTVYFKDDSLASEGATINSRVWDKDTIAFDSGNNVYSSVAANVPSMNIRLTVQDTAGRSTSKTHTIGVRMPLPTWKEIPPF